MAEENIGAVVVVDDQGYLEGLISQTDLVRAEASNREFTKLPDILPEHIMTRNVITTTPDESLADGGQQADREPHPPAGGGRAGQRPQGTRRHSDRHRPGAAFRSG